MAKAQVINVAEREVTITNPDKVVFALGGRTKIDLVRYYLAVAEGALRGVAGRPTILKRFGKGIDEEAFLRSARPPSGRTGSRWPSCTTPRGGRPRRSSYGTRRSWPGSSTSAASTSTRIRCRRRISTGRTSCESTWI